MNYNFVHVLIIGQFFLMSTVMSSSQRVQSIPAAEDSEQFFKVYDSILYVPKFNPTKKDFDKFKATSLERVFRIPVSYLSEKFDIEKGMRLAVINFKNKTTSEYVIKDYVNAVQFKVQNKSTSSEMSIILSDDKKLISQISDSYVKRRNLTGIAYLGDDRKATKFNEVSFPVRDIPDVDPLHLSVSARSMKKSSLKEAKVFDYRVVLVPANYIDNPKEHFHDVFFVKSDGSIWGESKRSKVLDEKQKTLQVLQFFEGTYALRLFEIDDLENEYHSLLIVSPKKLELINLGADPEMDIID